MKGKSSRRVLPGQHSSRDAFSPIGARSSLKIKFLAGNGRGSNTDVDLPVMALLPYNE